MQKTIFITGASAGLGKAVAKLFHSKGWTVIATMRNPEKETELSKIKDIIILPLDITNLDQINSTVSKAISLRKIDVVFNNAGYGLNGALEALSDEQIVRQLNTNLLGTIRVTKAFIPSFRENKSGLFITTTSIGGLCAFPLSSIYHATKWALEGWSESLSFELNFFNIGIKTIAPGGIKTDFMERSLDVSTSIPYQQMEETVFNALKVGNNNSSTPEQIAEVVYEAATDGKDQIRYVAGDDAKDLYNKRLDLGSEIFRKEIAKLFL